MRLLRLLQLTGLIMGANSKILAPLLSSEDAKVIPGKYIVVLKPSVGVLSMHSAWLQVELDSDPESKVEHAYNFTQFKGYSGRFSDALLAKIRENELVDFVEMDQEMGISEQHQLSFLPQMEAADLQSDDLLQKESGDDWAAFLRRVREFFEHHLGAADSGIELLRDGAGGTTQKNAPWGLSRVSSKKKLDGANTKYSYISSAGKDVDVYVIDTGININHVDFQGRAKWGVTIPLFDEDIDGNGHGTHCAGVIGGKTYGIAKKATVIAVKVLRTSGFGSNADVIKGVEWVLEQHLARSGQRKTVANMSLGGGRSAALEAAVNYAVESGVHFAVAAGNDNADACNYSPAAATGPITVGACNRNDEMVHCC
jgi:cerevisin